MRGRAPTTHFFQPSDEGDGDELIGQVSHGTYAECVNELVCLDVVCGQSMVDRIKQAWDSGDAIFPLDQRLPAPERARVLQTIKPTIVYDGNDDVRIEGDPVEPGDAVVVATSGTTGQPKGVVLTHDAVNASARATSEALELFADFGISHVRSRVIAELSDWERRLVAAARAFVGGTSVIIVDQSFDGHDEISVRTRIDVVVRLCAGQRALVATTTSENLDVILPHASVYELRDGCLTNISNLPSEEMQSQNGEPS